MADESTLLEAVRELCKLLEDHADPAALLPLSLAQFQTWKSLIGSRARAGHPAAATMAQLVVHIGVLSQDDSCLALSWWTNANVFMQLSEPAKSVQAFQHAENIYQRLSDALNVARVNVGKVFSLCESGHALEAVVAGEDSLRALLASPEDVARGHHAVLYNNLGVAYEQIGQYTEARRCYQGKLDWLAGVPFDERQPEIHETDVARTQMSSAVTLTYLGQYAEAAQVFAAARMMLLAHIHLEANRIALARLDMNMAWLETLRGSPAQQVMLAFERAKQSRADIDAELVKRTFAWLDLDEVNWMIHNDPAQTIDIRALQEIRDRCQQSEQHSEAMYAELLLGQLHIKQGNLTRALVTFTEVEKRASDQQNVIQSYLARLWQARVQRLQGDRNAAMDTLTRAIRDVEQIRAHLPQDAFRAGYLEHKLAVYHDLTALQLATRDIVGAFATSERAKSSVLTGTLIRHNRFANDQSSTQPIPNSPDSLATDIDPVHIARKLRPDTLAISYALMNDEIWAYLISSEGLYGVPTCLGRCPAGNGIAEDLWRITAITRLSPPTVSYGLAHYRKSAQVPLAMWHHLLIEPLADKLLPYKHVLIAPDGRLNRLPFACFFDARQQKYLGETHAVAIVPSLTSWALLQRRDDLGRTPSSIAVSQALCVGFSCAGRLPGAIEEAQQVARQFGNAHLLLESEATLDRFVAEAAQADVIYIASHGEYHDHSVGASYIQLADGKLTASDIANLRLRARTVVLSACETGSGQLLGNEMMGLVRAFLIAGAQSVVGTHWPIDDAGLLRLMTSCIQGLARGNSMTDAINLTQREFISATTSPMSHPYYWGALAVHGYENTG